MRDFLKLEIWQRSHQITLKIYQLTKSFPKEEIYGLRSQMQRSASSVPTNIAEGCGRNSQLQTLFFFDVAAGSCAELMYQVILIKDLSYITNSVFKELSDEITIVRKMIHTYSEKLRATAKS